MRKDEKNIESDGTDSVVVMTDMLHRSFNALGCDPMCHCCKNMIVVNDKSKIIRIFES